MRFEQHEGGDRREALRRHSGLRRRRRPLISRCCRLQTLALGAEQQRALGTGPLRLGAPPALSRASPAAASTSPGLVPCCFKLS